MLTKEQREWCPMETAPKDGTPVLGWFVRGLRPRVTWFEPIRERVWLFHGPWASEQPTHWQPLPSPPKEGT